MGWQPVVQETVPASNVTYTAQWKINQYEVAFDGNGGALGDRALPSVTNMQDYGSAIVPPSASRAGCTFEGWTPDVDATVPARDVAYTAQWKVWDITVKSADVKIKDLYPDDYGRITNIVIGAEIGILPSGFFDGCDSLESITFLSPETDIGDNDLRKVGRLFDVQPDGYWIVQGVLLGHKGECSGAIPDVDSIRRVIGDALEGCIALTDLTFTAESVLTSVGTNAFKGCTELRALTLPPSLEDIGDEAFMGCSYLDNVIVPGSVKRVGARAFKNCTGFTGALIEYGVESLGDEAFYGDWRISEVDIPSSVTNIGVSAFGGDSSIIRVGLRGDVRKVSEIFSNYAILREATVKEGDGAIVDGLFEGCVELADVHFLGNSPELANDGRNIYSGTPETLTTYVATTSTGWDGTKGSHSLSQAWPLAGIRRSIAQWDLPTYLVLFDSNGGTLGVQSTYQYSERKFTLPPEPVQTGYKFAGWWTKPVGGLRVTGDTVFIEGVYRTLYAHWTKGRWVFLDPNGGTVENEFVTYIEQTEYGVLPTPVRTGYAFDGWTYNGKTVLATDELLADEDHVLIAEWRRNKYMIAFDPNAGNGGVTNELEYASEIVPPVVTREGYTFAGWMPALSETVPASNVTYMAQWQINQYEVAFDGNGGALGESALPRIVALQDYGSTIVAPTVTKEGHTFVGWSPEVDTTVPASNVTYTAQWEINKYTVRFDPQGGTFEGRFEEEDPLLIATNGIPVGTLPTPVRPGNIFLGWYDGEESEEPIGPETVITGDLTLYARWVEAWTVTLNANGGSFVDEDGGTGANAVKVLVAKGGPLGERALPELAGYTFAGWWTKKSGGTKIKTSTKVTKDVTYYAQWTVKKFKVAATVNTKAGGAVSGAGTKTYGSKVTLKAAPKKGYVFVRWINTNDEDTPWPSVLKCRQPSVAFKMGAGNVSVKAVFAKASADLAPVLSVEPGDVWYVEDDPGREISVAADSLSYPAVTLSGAPAGIGLVRVPDTDDRYVLKVTDAAKMKPGVYTAKVTAKNRAGKSASKSVKIVTPNSDAAIRNGLVAGLRTSTLDPYVVNGGMKVNMTLADLGVEVFQTNGWKLASVAGLPTGLSWNGTAIVGAASKAGVFTVTFTMKKTVKDSKTKKTKTFTSTATATFAVNALLPVEVAGAYNGFANTNVADLGDSGDESAGGDGDDDEVKNVIYTPIMDGWASAVKVTVTTAGKITANIGGVAISGSGFDSVSNGVYAVTLKKTQKITKGSLKGKSKVWEAYIEIDTNAAWCGRQISGWFYTYTTGIPSMTAPAYISAQRNAFGDDDAKAMASAVAGTRNFALKSVKGEEWAYDLASGGKALSVVVKQNGAATLSGKIGTVKVSGTATLEVGETAATVRFFTSKFVIEVTSVVEDGEVAETFGKVWRR